MSLEVVCARHALLAVGAVVGVLAAVPVGVVLEAERARESLLALAALVALALGGPGLRQGRPVQGGPAARAPPRTGATRRLLLLLLLLLLGRHVPALQQ